MDFVHCCQIFAIFDDFFYLLCDVVVQECNIVDGDRVFLGVKGHNRVNMESTEYRQPGNTSTEYGQSDSPVMDESRPLPPVLPIPKSGNPVPKTGNPVLKTGNLDEIRWQLLALLDLDY